MKSKGDTSLFLFDWLNNMKKKADQNYRSAIGFLKTLLPVIVFLLLYPQTVFSQFTYLQGGAGYQATFFHRSSDITTEVTLNHAINLNVKFIHRPIRNFGIGAGFAYPVFQNTKFSFIGAETNSSYSTFRNFEEFYSTERTRKYQPEEFNYQFKQSFTGEIFARGFIDTYVNAFVGLNFSYSRMEETFVFKRSYKAPTYYSTGNISSEELVARDYNYTEVHNLFIPGFSLGIMPHVTDHLFLTFHFNLDFMIPASANGFRYTVEYDWDSGNDRHNTVVLESQADGLFISPSINIGAGYFF